MANVRRKLAMGTMVALAVSTPVPSIADVIITETGTVTGFSRSTNPSAPSLIGDSFTATIDFNPTLPQVSYGACQTELCYFANGNSGTTTISAGGQTLVEPNSYNNLATFTSPTGSGTYNALKLESGSIGLISSMINATALPIPDPFLNSIVYSSAVSGTLLSQNPNILSVNALSLGSENISVVINNLAINSIAPPTSLDLSQMAQLTYTPSSSATVNGYQLVQTLNGTGGFAAEVFRNGNQVVVAFRGTNDQNAYDQIKNKAADLAFVNGTSNSILDSEVTQAATLLKTLNGEPQFAGDNFYLTGHSLGGAVAQLLSNVTKLPATVFDAPGAGALVQHFGSLGLSGVTFANTGSDMNIRLYGDQVSLVGQSIGTTMTLSDTNIGEQTTNDLPWLDIEPDHSIATIVQQLQKGATPTSGIAGPQLNLAQVAQTIGTELFISVADTQQAYAIDPAGSGVYQLLGSSGSPFLHSITLPFLSGISTWDVETLSNGLWSSPINIIPGQENVFGDNVIGVQFFGLTGSGDLVNVAESFIFDAKFASVGEFNGTLTGMSGVPEPASWLLNIVGLGIIGMMLRRRKERLVQGDLL